MDKKLIDPLEIEDADLPLIVFSANATGLIGWLIRWRTNASYSHVMWMHKPGLVATQNLTYKEVKIKKYMAKNSRMKFCKINGLTPVKKALIHAIICNRLKKPWWKRTYDFLGILGEALGLRWIQSPRVFYCSEQMANDLNKVVGGIPKRLSPTDLNKLFKEREDVGYYGHYFFD